MPEPIRPNLFGTTHKIKFLSSDGTNSEVELTGPIVVGNNQPSDELLNKLLEKTLNYIGSQESRDPANSLDIELPFLNSGGDSVNSILRISFVEKGYKLEPDSDPSEINTIYIVLIRDRLDKQYIIKETTTGMVFKYEHDVLTDADKLEIKECISLAIKGADELTRRASARQGLNQVSRSIFDANSSNSSENN